MPEEEIVFYKMPKTSQLQIYQNKKETEKKNPLITHTGKISDLIKLDSNSNINMEKPLHVT